MEFDVARGPVDRSTMAPIVNARRSLRSGSAGTGHVAFLLRRPRSAHRGTYAGANSVPAVACGAHRHTARSSSRGHARLRQVTVGARWPTPGDRSSISTRPSSGCGHGHHGHLQPRARRGSVSRERTPSRPAGPRARGSSPRRWGRRDPARAATSCLARTTCCSTPGSRCWPPAVRPRPTADRCSPVTSSGSPPLASSAGQLYRQSRTSASTPTRRARRGGRPHRASRWR